MRKAIIIGEEPKEESNPIEFIGFLSITNGWISYANKPAWFDKVVYLGKCTIDGDMFACYKGKAILIYKGNLNDGTY